MKRGNKRKFGREHQQRVALLQSLATALINNGKIKTTKAKAKTLSSHIERLITRAKDNNTTSRRLLAKKLSAKTVKKLVDVIAPSMHERKGGYTRILPLGQRHSDGAEMSFIEFVS